MTAKIKLSERSAALRKLIGLAGGIAPLAKRIGLEPSSVAGWKDIPLKRVLEIETAFGGEVTLHEMAPEYFGEK